MTWAWYRDGAPVTQEDLGELQTGHPSLMIRDGALIYFSPGTGWRRLDGTAF